jgi:lipopolysaccharide transport system permease protein
MSFLTLAVRDFKQSAALRRVWMHLGWVEVKQRYRRSVIGPWWISLSMLIFIFMMGIVFSRLFHQELDAYIPFFTAGFLFWTFISTSVSEAAEIFRANVGFIKQMKLPYNLYLFKHLVRQLICLMHNAVVYVLVCLFFQFNPGWNLFWVIPGLFLLTVNMYWICSLISVVCTRFRDVVPMISSCVQIAFFVTPISWTPRLLDQNSAILKWNPLVYLLEVVRAPCLGSVPSLTSYTVVSALALGGCALSFFVFARLRTRIAFWVD